MDTNEIPQEEVEVQETPEETPEITEIPEEEPTQEITEEETPEKLQRLQKARRNHLETGKPTHSATPSENERAKGRIRPEST